MPHESRPCTPPTPGASSRPCTPPTPGAPRRLLGACPLARPAASTPRVCSVLTPRRPRGTPSPGAACGGAPAPPRRAA
eukprot:1746793-Prymnesium_polylepis.1